VGLRRETWDHLRAALLRLRGEERGLHVPMHRDVVAVTARAIAWIAAGGDPDGARLPGGRHAVPAVRLAGDAERPAHLGVIACALALDGLRVFDEQRRISGEGGWAVRRWAWAELAAEVERWRVEDPRGYSTVAVAAERRIGAQDAESGVVAPASSAPGGIATRLARRMKGRRMLSAAASGVGTPHRPGVVAADRPACRPAGPREAGVRRPDEEDR